MTERFLRTNKGILNYPLIYDKPVVCVEGPDDEVFWDKIFDRKLNYDAKIKPFGGKEELNKIADMIISLTTEKRKIIVIFDMDYSKLLGTQKKHPQIIYLNRYSIENYFICEKNLLDVAKKIARTSENTKISSIIKKWRKHIAEAFNVFIIYDFASQLHHKKERIYPDKCDRFLQPESPWEFKKREITEYIKTNSTCSKEELDKAKSILENNDGTFFRYIRGKFVMGSVSNMIRYVNELYGHKKRPSNKHLSDTLIDACSICNKTCKDFEEILQLLRHAISVIQDN